MTRQETPPPEGLETRKVTELKGVGGRVAERLARLDIHTVQDLLFHLPLRYQDRTRVTPIANVSPGDEVVVVGRPGPCEIRMGRRRSLLCPVSDATGVLTLRLFHFSNTQRTILDQSPRVRCFGEVRRGPQGLEMVHPEYSVSADHEPVEMDAHLTPVYPTTEGLHQLSLRRLVDAALDLLEQGALPEYLPGELLRRQGFPTLEEAVRLLHRPPPEVSLRHLQEGDHPAQRRLVFEELLAHHLSLRTLRTQARSHNAPVLSDGGQVVDRFLEGLPFTLTQAQSRVIREIRRDLAQSHPMLRLLQGDVGSGKTVVAAVAALVAVAAGYQVAVMAPTEVLSEQHWHTFGGWLRPLEVPLAWISGRMGVAQRRDTLAEVADGTARLVVGTHALFQEEVSFQNLGLVVVDEQHRFGVHQRMALRDKGLRNGRYPHQLIMTATPIPRTLAMTAYADLDTSVIDERPPGRTPVETVVVSEARRGEVIERIRGACEGGRQAYWVCTLIDESESLQAQAASDTAATLQASLPGLRVGLVHGRMKATEKESVMQSFKAGEVQLLVATTVIEVGVDVPRASLMIIENAERLGLAQLHQLRGRVGRGSEKSSCVLLYRPPLGQTARSRLQTVRETDNGFAIADRDLKLRGPGELLGTRQTGLPELRVADLSRDGAVLPMVASTAGDMLRLHPERVSLLVRRWIGNGVNYGDV